MLLYGLGQPQHKHKVDLHGKSQGNIKVFVRIYEWQLRLLVKKQVKMLYWQWGLAGVSHLEVGVTWS